MEDLLREAIGMQPHRIVSCRFSCLHVYTFDNVSGILFCRRRRRLRLRRSLPVEYYYCFDRLLPLELVCAFSFVNFKTCLDWAAQAALAVL